MGRPKGVRKPSYIRLIPQHLEIAKRATRAELNEKLAPREVDIIVQRFGLDGEWPVTYDDLAKEWGLSPERVRQLAWRSVRRLLKPGESLGKDG